MTVFETLQKALMVGLGAQERVKEFVDELIKKGELSEAQGAKLVKEWSKKAGKTGDDLSENIATFIKKTFEKMSIPTVDDIEKLNRKLQSLSARLKKLEESIGSERKGTKEQ